ncbi:MAG TPA: AAA family ATPase, partial [Candidatus Spyradenecus faecavium]|nr:AAA family ATPase [Candidatus Spyradenecus faecavium]
MQDIAQSTYDFRVMRENGSVYVDKTGLLYPFIRRDRDALYFVSRPRRFGKSLMLSTLKYLFQGRRDLFKGLAIDSLD